LHCLRQLRAVRRQLLQQGVGAHAEHAAVPQEIAAFQVGLGGGGIGLLDEALDVAGLAALDGLACLDVAVARFRAGRPDAEGDQLALGGQRCRFLRLTQELLDRRDQVVGRQHQHDGVGRNVGRDPVRRSGDGRRRVAPYRLQQVAGRGGAAGAQRAADFVLGDEIVVTVGDQQDLLARGHLGGALHGLAQQGLAVGQLHEGLGMAFARDRPQARARPSGEDHGDDGMGTHILGFQREHPS
jgi:hypothetical protein